VGFSAINCRILKMSEGSSCRPCTITTSFMVPIVAKVDLGVQL
jgi:hypothetical protein